MTKQAHDLKVQRVAVGDLKPYPDNPRQGDIGAVVMSLSAHGQFRPLVVQRSTGYVLAGNHTLAAAIQLGWADIAVTYLDVDDEQAKRIVLVDNRTSDLAVYDDSALVELLRELAGSDDGLEGTGFDEDALDALIQDLEQPLDLGGLEDRADAGDADGAPPGDAQVRIVEYHFPITREQYTAWIEQLKMAAGDSREEVIAELRERLGLPE